ncbi:MAG: thiamine pyrophosphate-binding protein [bacterium]
MKKFLGAELFFETLYDLGIRTIFGLPGGYVLKIYDVMPSYSKKITHVLTRHEQAATHMADGFSRASGLPGIILCTSGPAATNTITGITTAYSDSVPVLIFTGQVPTPFLGSDAFQEADHIGITRSCTKHNTLVRKTVNLPKAIAEALFISNTGKKGPVLVDMPKDVLISESEYKLPKEVKIKGYNPEVPLKNSEYESFKKVFKDSKRPLLIFGKGACSDSNKRLISKFLNKAKLPVMSSIMSLGLIDDNNKFNFGVLGEGGSAVSEDLINKADLIISIGCDLIKIVPEDNLKNKDIIVVNIDKSNFNAKTKGNLNIHTNSDNFIEKLSAEKGLSVEWEVSDLERFREKYQKAQEKEIQSNSKSRIFKLISDLSPKDTVFCSDFSYEDVILQKFLSVSDFKNSILSGGNGTPGYGFPAAIGATFARPKSKVISISSGTNFQFNMQELIVTLEQKIDLTIVVLNDKKNKIKKYSGPDYKSLGESFGVKSHQLSYNDKSFENNFKKSFNHKGTALIEILI